MAGLAHRADHAEEHFSHAAILLHFLRRLADRLNDQRHRSVFTVEIGNRQRNAFTVFMGNDNDELTRLGRTRHHRVIEFQQEC